MKPAYLDHIGIAVGANSRLAKALALLGLPVTGSELVEREKVDTDWVPLPLVQGNVELLKPTDPESVIGKFLAKGGRDGIHHLSFRVEDIVEVSALLVAAGFRLTYPEARPGARNFVLWTLARIDAPAARAAVRAALADRDAAVIHTALQITSLWRDAAARAIHKRFGKGAAAWGWTMDSRQVDNDGKTTRAEYKATVVGRQTRNSGGHPVLELSIADTPRRNGAAQRRGRHDRGRSLDGQTGEGEDEGEEGDDAGHFVVSILRGIP